MFTCNYRLWVIPLIFLSSHLVIAAPMGFEGSVMTMGDFNQNWREAGFNYAITSRDALGLTHLEFRSDNHKDKREVDTLNYTRLLSRWNLTDAQSNLWLFMGIGEIRGSIDNQSIDSKFIASPGFQFDYETTRIYFAATHKLYRASNLNHDTTSIRAGFSFYEADYDETQPWFILETKYTNQISDKIEVIPMLRLINKNIFVEGGVNNSGQSRLNLMYTF
ncbi:hypothetical protein FIT76_03470 [Candidatus Methylopumilus universalis]|uniref:hypothetical protein n=1 Tax=Candidatus Methylopumilus universalis TaxID=2588536 RepID=UPI00111F7BAF|nr:hypothetical protein [Candidatus Methylopumilus universalis]QDC47382.1 hypothetical protein FIT76_03470 [Candidatus Methylopumilus universalis]QDC71914.1 hypothetical protein FIT75_03520 [Candidatus Methylopumilus universalis]